MNRIGVMVDSFKLGLMDGLDAAQKVGAAAVQIYVGGRYAARDRWTASVRRDVIHKLKDNGLVVSAMCGDMGGHGFMDRADNLWKIDETKRMFDLTRELGCDIVTTHIGVVPEDENVPRRAIMLEAMNRLSDYGKDVGCHLAIETGPERPPILKKFVEEVESGMVGVNFDPANLKMVLDVDAAEGVRTLKGHILHTHAKDGRMLKFVGSDIVYGISSDGGAGDGGNYYVELPLGKGDVDFKGWIAALDEIGYKGYFTIEREVGDNPYADIEMAVGFLKGLGL